MRATLDTGFASLQQQLKVSGGVGDVVLWFGRLSKHFPEAMILLKSEGGFITAADD